MPDPEPLALAEAQRRFEAEATWGVCPTGSYRCPYFVWGTGPPMVLIPGLADDARSFVQLAAHLAEHFRCIAYDLPAGGNDGANLRQYTHDRLVADVFALLDHLAISQSYVLGSSFGSTIALGALRARPERLPRAVLQGGFAWRPLAPAEVLLARLAKYWPGTLRLLPFRKAILRRNHYASFAHRTPDVWDYFLVRSNTPPMAAAAHRALLIHQIDLRPILAEIRQPVLLICGDNDPLVSPACAETLLNGLANSGRIDLANCGHNPLFTHPELLGEIVRWFLTPPDCPGEYGGCNGLASACPAQ
jgi:pimeloyl-ACP methyl ester carboxylesterase